MRAGKIQRVPRGVDEAAAIERQSAVAPIMPAKSESLPPSCLAVVRGGTLAPGAAGHVDRARAAGGTGGTCEPGELGRRVAAALTCLTSSSKYSSQAASMAATAAISILVGSGCWAGMKSLPASMMLASAAATSAGHP